MELVHFSSDPYFVGLPPRHSEHQSWCSQQTLLTGQWMGAGLSSPPQHRPKMGSAGGESLCYLEEQIVHAFLLKEIWATILWGMPSVLEEEFALCVFSSSTDRGWWTKAGQSQGYPYRTKLVETILVLLPASSVHPSTAQAPGHSSFPLTECVLYVSLQSRGSLLLGMVPRFFTGLESSCSTGVTE